MTTFDDLEFLPRSNDMGVQAKIDFPNGYGASVIKGQFTYGGPEGLYELAVLKDGHLCYDTPVTNDVEGHLSPEDVTRLLGEIESLPTAVE